MEGCTYTEKMKQSDFFMCLLLKKKINLMELGSSRIHLISAGSPTQLSAESNIMGWVGHQDNQRWT